MDGFRPPLSQNHQPGRGRFARHPEMLPAVEAAGAGKTTRAGGVRVGVSSQTAAILELNVNGLWRIFFWGGSPPPNVETSPVSLGLLPFFFDQVFGVHAGIPGVQLGGLHDLSRDQRPAEFLADSKMVRCEGTQEKNGHSETRKTGTPEWWAFP